MAVRTLILSPGDIEAISIAQNCQDELMRLNGAIVQSLAGQYSRNMTDEDGEIHRVPVTAYALLSDAIESILAHILPDEWADKVMYAVCDNGESIRYNLNHCAADFGFTITVAPADVDSDI